MCYVLCVGLYCFLFFFYYIFWFVVFFFFFFFFSSRRRHTRYWRDWSSDVCSSDLAGPGRRLSARPQGAVRQVRLRLRALRPFRRRLHPLPDQFRPAHPRRRAPRSEERRVGKEWRSRWWACC